MLYNGRWKECRLCPYRLYSTRNVPGDALFTMTSSPMVGLFMAKARFDADVVSAPYVYASLAAAGREVFLRSSPENIVR